MASTSGNDESSRSHTLIRITVEGSSDPRACASKDQTVATLSLIDLAGSESAKVCSTIPLSSLPTEVSCMPCRAEARAAMRG